LMTIGDQPVYTPPGGLSASPLGALFGKPVIEVEQCSALGDLGDILFVNMKEYVVITKGGIDCAESMHVYFKTGENAFRWIARNNGQPKAKSAITPYKGAATQ